MRCVEFSALPTSRLEVRSADVVCTWRADTILGRERSIRHAAVPIGNKGHPLLICKFSRRMTRPFQVRDGGSSFGGAVRVVDCNRSREQVCRVATDSVIATVARKFIRLQFGAAKFKRPTMCANHLAHLFERAVAAGAAFLPRPAFIRPFHINPLPKLF